MISKLSLAMALLLLVATSAVAKQTRFLTEAEENIFTYQYAATGAGPTWCFGSAILVRTGDRLFASGQVPIPGVTGINAIQPTLYERTSSGWKLVYTDPGASREPSPIAAISDNRLLMSNNRSDAKPDEYDGPAHPIVLSFDTSPSVPPSSLSPESLIPVWSTELAFHGHTYRCFASDSANGEFFLSWNIAYDRTYWTFYDRNGKWAKQGELMFPVGSEYPTPEPLRLCYSPVLIRDRQVHYFGIADIEEPIQEWRDAKFELSKSKWDYVFRRLFYCYTPDITKKAFSKWIEIANLDKTAGSVWASDIYQAKNGDIYLLWHQSSVDSRLKSKFFPDVKQVSSINCTVLRKGRVVKDFVVASGGEGIESDEVPQWARFHLTPDGAVFVVYAANVRAADGTSALKNRVREIQGTGEVGQMQELNLKHAFNQFFTTSPRSGSKPSDRIEITGTCIDTGNDLRYARIYIK